MASACGHLLFPACGCAPAPVKAEKPAPTPIHEEPDEDGLELPLDGDMEDPEYLALAAELLKELDAMAARDSLAEYCRQAWPVVEQSTTLDWNWHHELICNVVQGMFEEWEKGQDDKAFKQQVLNAAFNVPPGSLKSRILAVFFPTWAWTHRPGWKVICLSVNEDATLRDGRASRDILRSDWYQRSFKPTWRIKDDQDAISNYGNTAGGERLSRASGSEIVGLRGDCIIIDDPNNPKEAESKTERDKVNDLWLTNIFNRVNDPLRSLRIGVQQRTHAGDWSGFVLETDKEWSPENPLGWLHVVLPAEFEAARRCVTPWGSDPRTEEGQAIHESRMPADWLLKERQRMREKYAGQMQQRPVMVEGGRVKRSYFNFVRLDGGVRPGFDGIYVKHPRPTGCNESEPLVIGAQHHKPGYWDFDWVVISLDCAAKKTERGSQWGMLVVAGKGERRFVLDDRTQRGDILEILEVLKDLARVWWPDKILIEDKAAGDDLKTMIQREMSTGDFPMVTLEMLPTGSHGKEERLDACAPVLKNGFVHLLDGARWLEEFVSELSMFPNGINDDRVDALTQVLNYTYDMFELPGW